GLVERLSFLGHALTHFGIIPRGGRSVKRRRAKMRLALRSEGVRDDVHDAARRPRAVGEGAPRDPREPRDRLPSGGGLPGTGLPDEATAAPGGGARLTAALRHSRVHGEPLQEANANE